MAGDSNYYNHLMTCFDYLQNTKRTNDEIMDHLLNNLSGSFEAALFLIENRDQINEDIQQAKEKLQGDGKQGTTDKNYATISSNIMVKKKKKNKKKDVPETQRDELLTLLGIKQTEDVVQKEENQLRKELQENREAQDDDEYAFFDTDFFRETQESLKTKFQMRRTDGLLNTVFDVAPKTKNVMYKQT